MCHDGSIRVAVVGGGAVEFLILRKEDIRHIELGVFALSIAHSSP